MKLKPIAQIVSLSALGLAIALPATSQAAFFEDSKASLELRNFYMNRDWREDAGPNKAEEWAQGFIFKYESGFTEGTIGVGVDALAVAGFKLDSGRGTSGTGLLLQKRKNHKGRDGHVPDSYGEIGATFKAKLSESTLRAGTLMPKLPVVSSGDLRLLPQTFTGVQINSKEINNLSVDLGRLGRVNHRNSTDNQPINVWVAQNAGVTKNHIVNDKGDKVYAGSRFGKVGSNKFDFASLSYNWGDTGLKTGYHFGKLHNGYKQHIINGAYTHQIADDQALTTDLRYARTREENKSGIDNKAISAMLSYKLGHNNFALGYQKMSGDTGYAYLAETDPFLTNYVMIRDFALTDEKSWQARYIHDFASIGVPGLTLMTRYIRGTNIYMGAGAKRGTEWERDTDIGYVVQNGTFKGLGVKWRNGTMRSDAVRNIDENRIIVSYTLPLL